MSELLDAAIEEIGRVLIGNKDRNTEEVYLKNAIRHIREYGSQPQINEDQKNKTNNNLLKINDLAFDLQHDDELTAEQFWKVKQIFELSLQYQLDENQQIVLDWLKAYSERSTFSAMYPIFQLGDYDRRVLEGPRQIDRAFSELNFRQESQVLQAYSQWALEQEEEK